MELPLAKLGQPTETAIVAAFSNVFGPVSVEFGQFLADLMRRFRIKNFHRVMEIAAESEKAQLGLLKPPPPKFFTPLIEAASLEEDESILELWAALLVAASDQYQARHSIYLERLKVMSRAEAELLVEIVSVSPKTKAVFPAQLLQENRDGISSAFRFLFMASHLGVEEMERLAKQFRKSIRLNYAKLGWFSLVVYPSSRSGPDMVAPGNKFFAEAWYEEFSMALTNLQSLGLVSETYQSVSGPDSLQSAQVGWVQATNLGVDMVDDLSMKSGGRKKRRTSSSSRSAKQSGK